MNFCLDVLKKIKQLKIKWTGYVNPKNITYQAIQVFKKSGCQGLQVGLDALAEKTLCTYRKNFVVKDILHADKCFFDKEIPIYYWINFGGPGETLETIDESLGNAGKLNLALGYMGFGFMILPKTFLQKTYRNKNQELLMDIFRSEYVSENIAEQIIDSFINQNTRWFAWFDLRRNEYLSRARQIKAEGDANYWCRDNFEPINNNRFIKYPVGKNEAVHGKIQMTEVMS